VCFIYFKIEKDLETRIGGKLGDVIKGFGEVLYLG